MSGAIAEETEEAAEESDNSDDQAGMHNSASQTSLIRQKLNAEDNGKLSSLS